MEKVKGDDDDYDDDGDDDNILIMLNSHVSEKICSHEKFSISECIVNVGKVKFCALIDTGAQISIMGVDVCEALKQEGNIIDFKTLDNKNVIGLNGGKAPIRAIVVVKLKLLSLELKEPTLFAVVDDDAIPCCAVLGANFLVSNNIILDFSKHGMYAENDGEEVVYPFCNVLHSKGNNNAYNVRQFFGSFSLAGATDEESTDCYMEDVKSNR